MARKVGTKSAMKATKIVPDTSIIIERVISQEIEKGTLKPTDIIIHEAVVSELESQANKGREVGLSGLEEIKNITVLAKKHKFKVEFKGSRPGEFHIKYAKSGEIDSMIRELASEEKATLMTADKVQAFVAESKGIKVILYEFEQKAKSIALEKFFDKTTMSVHLKEKCLPKAKKGLPGAWKYVDIGKKKFSREDLQDMAKEIIEEAHIREDSFVEIERAGSSIIQLHRYRIVITRPPFADGYEITAVKPIKRLSLEDYEMSEKLKERINGQAEGILISGAPGHGKTTFAQALAEFYNNQGKVVKTVEAPRDLVLPDDITQYAISHGSSREIHDILLLSRPDYTIFDEMRNTSDFKLFSDLRLSGVGMIGVVHATQTIDAVQRFIGRIELGVVPHIIDTVIFIKNGAVENVYSLSMQVKVPSGMTEADLARPVVVVNDFETGKLEFEIYTYGEQTVVIPVQKNEASPVMKLATKSLKNEMMKYANVLDIEMVSAHKAVVYVPVGEKGKLIGKGGENIERIEASVGIGLDIRESSERKAGSTSTIQFHASIGKQSITFMVDPKYCNKELDIYIDGDFFLTATVSKKSQIKITKNNKLGRILVDAINSQKVTLH
ncbi:PINc/VapC family ATPase [Nanoarchaeota archaeon]